MEEGKVNQLVVMLSHGANDDEATVGFTIANAALSSSMQVAIFVHNGDVLWSCAPCFRHRGMKQEETVEQTLVTGAGSLLEWVRDGAATLSI